MEPQLRTYVSLIFMYDSLSFHMESMAMRLPSVNLAGLQALKPAVHIAPVTQSAR